MSDNQIKKEFLTKLYALMIEYKAEFELRQCFPDTEDLKLHITLNVDGHLINFDLTRNLDKDDIKNLIKNL